MESTDGSGCCCLVAGTALGLDRVGYQCTSLPFLFNLRVRSDGDQVLEIALASKQEVVISTDGLGEALEGDEGTDELRASRNLGVPSKEAMDKFTDFSEPLHFSRQFGGR